jgi:hypothetical protein
MLDVVVIAVIVAFFLAGGLLVRGLGRLISGSDFDAPKDELAGEADGLQTDSESGSRARGLLDGRA